MYLKDFKDFTKHRKITEITGCKINIKKINVSLHTNNEQVENETRKTVPFTKASRKIKYLGIKQTKEVKDLYNEKYKTLRKGIEGIITRSKDLLYKSFFKLTSLFIFPKLNVHEPCQNYNSGMLQCHFNQPFKESFQKRIIFNFKRIKYSTFLIFIFLYPHSFPVLSTY
jgi:hypothetical protein